MKKSVLYRIALVGAILVVLLNTWIAARALHTLIDSESWLAHTLEVIDDTQQLVARVRTAESAARGYILTASPTFEDQYTSANQGVETAIEHIRQLTADNPSQQARIVDLRQRIAGKMTVLDAGIAVRRGHPTGMLDPRLLGAVIDDTPDRVESVQRGIREIQGEEQRLLAYRTSNATSARRQVWISFTIAFLLDFLLLVAAFELLIRAGRDRETLAERAVQIESLNTALLVANTELEDRVAQRTRELAISNQELEAFSYSVSHDLRAPLRTIDGFSLALLEDFADKLNDEGRDYIGRVRAGVQRMGQLIDALLQLSRVTRTELSTEAVDLSQLATLVFNELAANDPERQADPERRVTFTVSPTPPAQGDPRLLRIALENLIGNAFKFTSRTPQATITFASREEPGRTVYFVQDNGAGFDMHYVDRLFTAFQRLHGDRDFKGSGIGLATVSRIIRRHHGSIGAKSVPGQGATFFFDLAGQGQHPPAPTLHDETPSHP
jgi:signal transduction histidine kinase